MQKNIIDTIVKETIKANGTVLDVIKASANQLAQYGLGYLYIPDIANNALDAVEFSCF